MEPTPAPKEPLKNAEEDESLLDSAILPVEVVERILEYVTLSRDFSLSDAFPAAS